MNGYEKIVTMMKNAGNNTGKTVALGEMVDSENCQIDELKLEPEDYLIAERLKGQLNKGDMVVVLRYSEDIYLILEKVV